MARGRAVRRGGFVDLTHNVSQAKRREGLSWCEGLLETHNVYDKEKIVNLRS
jgi:hypothetical protein